MPPLEPGDLLVHRDGRFCGVQIVNVTETRDGDYTVFTVAILADRADWFGPDDPGAGPDGWVRNLTNVTGTFTLGTTDPHFIELWRTWLTRWEADARTDLEGDVCFDRQRVTLTDRRDKIRIGSQMSPGQLDRAR